MENHIEFGDAREVLKVWKDQGVKVQTCVTSPPYFGLRDYGVEGQIGLEQTPDDYVANMVEVFRCVRDILADDGTLWLNLGDSYGTGGSGQNFDPKYGATNTGGQGASGTFGHKKQKPVRGMYKQLLGIPWRVAFALQADGWYLRQDIIWHKPNPMPESVTDRCTKAHEYVFLLSKSERYFFDSEAMREPLANANAQRTTKHYNTAERYGAGNGGNSGLDGLAARMRSGEVTTRNRRSVWTVTTRHYKGAHFATFPPTLIEPCILAGTRSGDIVLDPFMGSGTTAMVAVQHGRRYLGIELNPAYKELQDERIAKGK